MCSALKRYKRERRGKRISEVERERERKRARERVREWARDGKRGGRIDF